MARGWPVTLTEGHLSLRPLLRSDAKTWSATRIGNEAWLKPWEATPGLVQPKWRDCSTEAVFHAMRRRLAREARHGKSIPFAIAWDGRLIGQLTFGSIVRGAFESCYAGYWIDRAFAGRGAMPTALAMGVDHCFGPVGLHRVEVNVRPENEPSRRVVEKLGFREEGLQRNYLAIGGAYRDHIGYALTSEDVPLGLLARWKADTPIPPAG